MDKPWPVDIPLMQDEILSSWIIRTAFGNGSYPLAWSWFLWGSRRVWTIDIDRFCPLSDMLKLVTQNVSLSAVESATLYPWLRKVTSIDLTSCRKSWPWLTTLGARNRDRTGGLRYCPECLVSSPVYYRRAWRFAWNHSCAVHNCILKDTCPACSSSVCPHKLNYKTLNLALCASCGFNLSEAAIHSASKDALRLQSLMSSALEGSKAELPWSMQSPIELFETVRYLISFLNRAYNIRLSADDKLLEFLGIVSAPNSPTHASIEQISVDRMHILSGIIGRIFEYEPAEFSEILSLIGYSKRTFLSRLNLPVSPQVQTILNILPDGVKRPRKKRIRNIRIYQPAAREKVEAMWRELLTFLP